MITQSASTTRTSLPPATPSVVKVEPPSFTELLSKALSQPGSLMKAYSIFHNYSLGNQLLATFQCALRGIPTGPINTFPGWKALGRSVRKGEKAISLCMPITVRRRNASLDEDQDSDEAFAIYFVYKSRWFVLSQTEGPDIDLPPLPNWDAALALHNLEVTEVAYTKPNGNCQGYARGREIAINPVAQLPLKTRFHEIGHVLLGHTLQIDFEDEEHLPRNLREVEAESVAYLCCEALGLEGGEFCRGYIQNWAHGEPIPESSARRILRVADQILKAGTPQYRKDPTAN